MWYWYMNFHIEHHMYANVPCYNLPALHEAINTTCHTLLAASSRLGPSLQRILKTKLDATHMQDVKLPANDG
eukprot:UN12918